MAVLNTPLSARGIGYALLACVAGLTAPAALAQVTLNADRSGGDIVRFADAGLSNDQCAARCEANAQCQAWVLVKDGSQGGVNVCYLKNTVAVVAPNRCCDTGVKVGQAQRPANAPGFQQQQLKGGVGAGPAQAGLQGGAIQGIEGSLGRAQAAEGGLGGGAPVQGQGPGQRGGPGQPGGQSQAGNGGFGGFGGAAPGSRNGPGGPGGRQQQGMGGGFGGGSAPGSSQGNGPGNRNGGGFNSGYGRAGGGQAGRSDGGSGPPVGSSGTSGGAGSPWNQAGSNGGGNAGGPQGTGGAGNQGWGPEGSPVRLVEGSNVSIEYTEMTEQQRDEKESIRIDAGPDKPKDKEDRPNPDSSRGSTPTPDGIGGGNSRAGFAGGSRSTPTDSSGNTGGRAGGTGSSGARLQGGGFVDPQGKVERVVNPGSNAGQQSDEGTTDWRPPPVIP